MAPDGGAVSQERDFFQVLEVERDATPDQIRKHYLRLVAVAHPDRGGSPDAFILLKQAYKILSHQTLKANYEKRVPPQPTPPLSPTRTPLQATATVSKRGKSTAKVHMHHHVHVHMGGGTKRDGSLPRSPKGSNAKEPTKAQGVPPVPSRSPSPQSQVPPNTSQSEPRGKKPTRENSRESLHAHQGQTQPDKQAVPEDIDPEWGQLGRVEPSKEPVINQVVLAVLAVVCWSAASSAIILLNKFLISRTGFDAPMVLCSLGMFVSSVVTFLLCRVFKVVDLSHNRDKVDAAFYFNYILPVGGAMAANLALGTYTFMYLPVTYIQMLKSLSPAMNYVALVLLDMERVTSLCVVSVTMIVIGTALASYGEMAFNSFGLALYLASEIFEIIRVIIIQIITQHLTFSPIEGMYYMAPPTFCCLLVAIMLFEYETVVKENLIGHMLAHPHIFVVVGILGFVVNATTWAVIKYTSALTLKVVGTAKNAGTVFFGHLIFGEEVTFMQLIGYGLSVLGFLIYNIGKAVSMIGKVNQASNYDVKSGEHKSHFAPPKHALGTTILYTLVAVVMSVTIGYLFFPENVLDFMIRMD